MCASSIDALRTNDTAVGREFPPDDALTSFRRSSPITLIPARGGLPHLLVSCVACDTDESGRVGIRPRYDSRSERRYFQPHLIRLPLLRVRPVSISVHFHAASVFSSLLVTPNLLVVSNRGWKRRSALGLTLSAIPHLQRCFVAAFFRSCCCCY